MNSAAFFVLLDGGQTWQKVIYKDENTGASDVEIDPSNPDVIYASMWEVREGPWEDGNEFNGTGGGLFKSTDGGDTWHPLNQRPAERSLANLRRHRSHATHSGSTPR